MRLRSLQLLELFYARANYLQRERGLERLIALRDQLAGRQT